MPNDAKLGLIVGMGLVITVAVVFFRKDSLAAQPAPEMSTPSTAQATNPPQTLPQEPFRPVSASKTARTDATHSGQRHVVAEGETLAQLAQRYYGDGDKSTDIYQANRDVLKAPEPLIPGTVLFIPKADEETAK
jgi:nucleoid-associated protein YgaU